MRAPLQGLGDRRKPFCAPVRPPAAISRFSDKKRRKATGPNGKFGNETPFAEFRQKDRKNSVPYGVPTKISVRRGFSTKSSPNPGTTRSASRVQNPGSLPGRGYHHFAVFRRKTRIPDGVGPPERGNSGKFAVLGQKTGAIFGNPTKISGIFGNPTKISKMRGFSTKSSPNSRAVGSASRARNPGSPFPAGDAAISRFSYEKSASF